MESIETAQISAGNASAVASEGFSIGTVARDVATVGSGTAIAAVFNILLVFLIPRLVSIEDFGYWRLFLLYSSYAGLLHMGVLNGALLRWAGRPLEEFHEEIGPLLKFLLWQQLAVILPGCLLAEWLLPTPMNLIAIAVLVFSLVFNAGTELQCALQGARLFRPVAVGIAAPPGLFVVMALLWYLHRAPGFRELILLYCIAWVGVLVYLWMRVRPSWGNLRSETAWSLSKTLMAAGWPIVLANGGFGFVQSADRLVVSYALPIKEFAEYSLAASAMFVPAAAILAVSRVFFSHAAALEHEGRSKVYAHASKLLVLAWSLLLPYYFVLEAFVKRFLPKYIPSLPFAAVMVLGIVFLAGIQILHMSYAYLYSKQRQFLILTVGMLVLSFGVATALAISMKSLLAVAAGQVGVLASWWIINEWNLRKETGQGWREWFLVCAIFIESCVWFSLALWFGIGARLSAVFYYALSIPTIVVLAPSEFRLGRRLIRSWAWDLWTQTREKVRFVS
jgi:O-antigen/teichoic acid export membrane protein